jgi:4-amino-4-deoxy-L-arabinose transferase-like glycosyltransferase
MQALRFTFHVLLCYGPAVIRQAPHRIGTKAPLILLVLVVAVGLRGWAINWGAPFLYHPDEHLILQPAMNMVRERTPNPHWFQYPSLLLYLEAGIVTFLQPVVEAPLTTDPTRNQIGPWDALPAQWPFALGGRVAVAIMALLGVWCLYRAGTSFSGVPVGLGAALLLVAAPLHNESSHFLTTDVPAATLLTAALALSLAGARAVDMHRLAAAGFVAGLAAGTKYTAGIALFVPLVVAMSGPLRSVVQRMLIVLAAAAVGFVIACPFAVLDFPDFWSGLQQQRRNYLGDNVPGSDWRWYISYLVDTGLLWPSAVACALGLLGMLWRGVLPRRRVDRLETSVPPRVHLAFVVVPAAYLAFLSWYPYRAQRNLVILLPFLCLAGADIGWRLVRRWRRGLAIAAYAALVCLLAAPGLVACVRHDRQLAQPETRTVALAWIEANLPANSRIAREEYTPQVPGNRYRVSYDWSLAERDYSWYLNQQVDYLVLSSSVYTRATHPPYVAGPSGPSFYQFVFRNLPLAAEFAPGAEHPGPVIRIFRVPHA